MTRQSDQIKEARSFVIKWKGNKPVVEESHWAPGYTPGHKETRPEAIAMEMAELMQHISDFREKWLNINLLAEQEKHLMAADAIDAVSPEVTVTETDDPHETMTMPEGAISVEPDTGAAATEDLLPDCICQDDTLAVYPGIDGKKHGQRCGRAIGNYRGDLEPSEASDFTVHKHNYWVDEGDDLRSKLCHCNRGKDHTDPNPWADYDDHQDH